MRIYGDNKAIIHIAENDVFRDRTKYIEVDCHIALKKLEAYIIVAKHVLVGLSMGRVWTRTIPD